MADEHPVTVVYHDDGARLGHWRNAAFFVWLGQITPPRIEGAHRVMDALLARGGGPIIALTVIPVMRVSNLAMDEPVRRRHADLYKKVAGRAVANAVAVETPGFVAAFVRAIIAGTLQLTRNPVPTRIFEARAHAAAWLVERTREADPALRAATLLDKLHIFTADIDAR